MDFKSFATNQELENQGTWHELGEGAKIKVARYGNKNFSKAFQQLYKPHAGLKKIPDEKAEEILIKTFAKTILVGWEGFKYYGKDLPYTEENAEKVLKELPDLRDLVADLSKQAEYYKIQEVEQAEKNLPNTSGGN